MGATTGIAVGCFPSEVFPDSRQGTGMCLASSLLEKEFARLHGCVPRKGSLGTNHGGVEQLLTAALGQLMVDPTKLPTKFSKEKVHSAGL